MGTFDNDDCKNNINEPQENQSNLSGSEDLNKEVSSSESISSNESGELSTNQTLPNVKTTSCNQNESINVSNQSEIQQQLTYHEMQKNMKNEENIEGSEQEPKQGSTEPNQSTNAPKQQRQNKNKPIPPQGFSENQQQLNYQPQQFNYQGNSGKGQFYGYDKKQLPPDLKKIRSLLLAANIMGPVSLLLGGFVLSAIGFICGMVALKNIKKLNIEKGMNGFMYDSLKRSATMSISICAIAFGLNLIAFIVAWPMISQMIQTGDYSSVMSGAPAGSPDSSLWG